MMTRIAIIATGLCVGLVLSAGAVPESSDSQSQNRSGDAPILQTDDFPVRGIDLSRTLAAGDDPLLLEIPMSFQVETNFMSHNGYQRHSEYRETGHWETKRKLTEQ